MKKWMALLIAAAMAASLACQADATESTAAASSTPTQNSEPEKSTATPMVTSTESAEPTPAATDSPEPTEAPAVTDSPEPTATPAPTDSPEPTVPPNPDESNTPAPSNTPTPSDSPLVSPSVTPTPTPAPTDEPENVGPDSSTENILQVQSWLATLNYLTEAQITGLYDEATLQAVAQFQTDMNAQGASLTVTGLCDAQTLLLLEQQAALAPSPSPNPEFPGGRPGGFPGGRPSGGGFGGVTGMQPNMEVETGGITPGEPLTDSHASGTKDTTPYGVLTLETDGESMPRLTLDGEKLNVSLRVQIDETETLKNAGFTATISGDTIELAGNGQILEWTLDGQALRTLNKSGANTLLLSDGENAVSVPTAGFLSGEIYTSLRSKGYTDNTLTYIITLCDGEAQITVIAGNESYAVSSDCDSELYQTGISIVIPGESEVSS